MSVYKVMVDFKLFLSLGLGLGKQKNFGRSENIKRVFFLIFFCFSLSTYYLSKIVCLKFINMY